MSTHIQADCRENVRKPLHIRHLDQEFHNKFVANTRVKRGSLVTISHQTFRCITWEESGGFFQMHIQPKDAASKMDGLLIIGLYLDCFLFISYSSFQTSHFQTPLFQGDFKKYQLHLLLCIFLNSYLVYLQNHVVQ